MRSRGKVITQMNEFSRMLYTINILERKLREEGRITIHCKEEEHFKLVELLQFKDTYTLRVGNSFSIFMKGRDK